MSAAINSGSSTGSEEGARGYLQQPAVMKVIDDLVCALVSKKPEDPHAFLVAYFAPEEAPKPITPQPPPTPPANSLSPKRPVVQPAQDSKDDGLLEWMVAVTESLAENGTAVKSPMVKHNMSDRASNAFQALQKRIETLENALKDANNQSPKSNDPSRVEGEEPAPDAARHSSQFALPGLGNEATVSRRVIEALTSAANLIGCQRSLEENDVVLGIVESAKQLLNTERCALFIADNEKQVLRSTIEGKQYQVKYGQGIVGTVAKTGKSERIPFAYEDKRFNPQIDLATGFVTRDILCCPIKRQGVLVAVAQLVNKNNGSFTKEDEQVFRSFAQFAAVHLHHAQLYSASQLQSKRNEVMSEITEELANSTLDEGRLVAQIVSRAKQLVGADRCSFFTVDDPNKQLLAHLEGVAGTMRMAMNAGVAGHVATTGNPLIIPDAYKDKRFNKDIDVQSGYKTHNILCVPIFADNKVVAVAQLLNKMVCTSLDKEGSTSDECAHFTDQDAELMSTFASIVGICVRNCRLFNDVTKRERQTHILLDAAKGMGTTDVGNVRGAIRVLEHAVPDALEAERCLVFSYDSGAKELTAYDPSQAEGSVGPLIRVPLTKGVVGTSVSNEEVSIIDIRSYGSVYENEFGRDLPTEPKSALVAPIRISNTLVAAIVVVNKNDGTDFNAEDASMLHLFSLFTNNAIRNAELFSTTVKHSNDLLTLVNYSATPGPIASSETGEEKSTLGENDELRSTASKQITWVEESDFMEAIEAFDGITKNEIESLPLYTFDIHEYRDNELPKLHLPGLMVHMFRKLDLTDRFKIQTDIIIKFVCAARSKYRNVPYHNFFHAFDVTQTMFVFLTKLAFFTPLERLTLMVAAMCHDIDHMGLNNAFHLKAETPMGILTSVTGAKSVLEVHHCQLTIEILQSIPLLQELTTEEKTQCYKLLIDCIMATDMAAHKDLMVQFEAELGSGTFDTDKLDNRRLAALMLLKMADISNATKPFDVSRKWGIHVMDEFYAQGDKERSSGMEVTPMFDRQQKSELAQGQIGFINFVAKPFFTLAAKCLPNLAFVVDGLLLNVETWERVLAQQRRASVSSV